MSVRCLTLLLAAALPIGGCNTFDFLERTAVEGVVIGTAVTDGETPLSGGPAIGVFFLAEATSINDVTSNLIESADSVTLSDSSESRELLQIDRGLWVVDLDAPDLLPWAANEVFTLGMERDGRSFSASVEAPRPPTLGGIPRYVDLDDLPDDWANLTEQDLAQLAEAVEDPELHPAGAPLTVEVSDEYQYWAVVVVDQSGLETYRSVPEEAGPLMNWLLNAEPVESLEIPGEAFPEPNALYAVGVAGLEFTQTSQYSGFNWLISNLGAGTLTIAPVVTSSP